MNPAVRPPVMIAVAPNGARRTQAEHPALPVSPAELARCADECAQAGASMLHLHVRDGDGRHSLSAAHYRPAITAIRERVGDALVVQVTTESAGLYTPREQIDAAQALEPDALSLALRELWSDRALHRDAALFLAGLAARNTLVQYIAYDRTDVALCLRLHRDGVVPQRAPHVLFVLGSYVQRRAGEPQELLPLLAALPPTWPWSVCAFGASELACVTAAATLGGHMRVGFENNVSMPSGDPAPGNAALVAACRDILEKIGARAASCSETRRILGDSPEVPTPAHPVL